MLRLLFETFRSASGRLPPTVLLALLVPPALLRATIDVWIRRRRPPTQLPPLPGVTRPARQALVDRLDFRLTPLAGFWADRTLAPRWRSRIDMTAIDELAPVLAERPVLMVSMHYGSLIMVPSLLCRLGVPTALAVGPDNWPLSRFRQWRLDLVKIGDIPTAVAAEARPMLRFLKPGRCLVVAVDYATPEMADVPFRGGIVRISTPPLRLARISRALVVPMLAFSDGLWRPRVQLGRPVPDELLQRGDYQAAAEHIAHELLPLAASAPGQALPTLIEAFAAGPS